MLSIRQLSVQDKEHENKLQDSRLGNQDLVHVPAKLIPFNQNPRYPPFTLSPLPGAPSYGKGDRTYPPPVVHHLTPAITGVQVNWDADISAI